MAKKAASKKAARKAAEAPPAEEALTDEQVSALASELAYDPVACPIEPDPAMGDKDPRVMDWYFKHAPEEYDLRYKNRVTPHNSGVSAPPRREHAPVSDFEDEEEEGKKPRVIQGE